MYSAYKLNKQPWHYTALTYYFPDLEPVPCSMCGSNCCFLTCIQISQEAGKMVWYSHLFKNFPVCCDPYSQRLWHCQWRRSRCFSGTLLLFWWSSWCWQFDLWFLCLFKTSLNIWKFTVHIAEAWLGEFWALLYKHVRWVQLCGSLSILWHCLSLGLEWKLTFSSPVATAEFSTFAGILSVTLSQHHLLGFETAQLEFHHLH